MVFASKEILMETNEKLSPWQGSLPCGEAPPNLQPEISNCKCELSVFYCAGKMFFF